MLRMLVYLEIVTISWTNKFFFEISGRSAWHSPSRGSNSFCIRIRDSKSQTEQNGRFTGNFSKTAIQISINKISPVFGEISLFQKVRFVSSLRSWQDHRVIHITLVPRCF